MFPFLLLLLISDIFSIDGDTQVKIVSINSTVNENKTDCSNCSVTQMIADVELNTTVPWDIFIAFLIRTSIEQLKNIQNNIINNYKLYPDDITYVNKNFKGIDIEYESILQNSIKKFISKKALNLTQSFMLNFMDISFDLIQKLLESKLDDVSGKFILPTKWYKQTMRDKILRQQTKITSNYIESKVCNVLSICRYKENYSEYLMQWIRHILFVDSLKLNELFNVVPDLLEKHSDLIKSNLKFKQTIKYIINSKEMVQMDTLDFVDEVLSKRNNVYKLVPSAMNKSAVLLNELFLIIDDNLDIDDDNESELDAISDMLYKWREDNSYNIKSILEYILYNMKSNIETWPLDVKKKISDTWHLITLL